MHVIECGHFLETLTSKGLRKGKVVCKQLIDYLILHKEQPLVVLEKLEKALKEADQLSDALHLGTKVTFNSNSICFRNE